MTQRGSTKLTAGILPIYAARRHTCPIIILLGLCILTARASILTVNNANDSGAGSLRAAVTSASAGDTINFDQSLSGQTIILTSGYITLDKNLNIDASALSGGVIISGNNASRLFFINANVTNLFNRLILTSGKVDGDFPDGYGGGIYSQGDLTLTNCTMTANSAFAGGAIYNRSGNLYIDASTLWGNSASYGGGLQNESACYANNSTICSNNAASQGGGISAPFGKTVFLYQCTVAGNSSAEGGGIRISAGGTTIMNTIVAGNTATSSSNIFGTFTDTGNNLTSSDPQLSPLGFNGGPTPTMPPLLGSPAIDGEVILTSIAQPRGVGLSGIAPIATDQRGLPRTVGATTDIGAVEFQPGLVVTSKSDSSENSLRAEVAFNAAGSTITFDASLSGQTIVLTNGEIVVDKNLTIDGSSLPKAIVIDGNHVDRVFFVAPDATVVLNTLVITNGIFNGHTLGSYGGGIENQGTLTLNRCSIVGNDAMDSYGGGIENGFTLTINQCTIAGNSALGGGGVATAGMLTVNQSTLSGNASQSYAGVIYGGGTMTASNSVVAGNIGAGLEIDQGIFTGTSNLVNVANPQLAALGDYGGPTPTMPPLFGSLALDAGNDVAASSFATDQRGFPRIVGPHVDIGAAEYVASRVVTTTADSGEGSLRIAVRYSTNATKIKFDQSLSGQTILLTSGEILLDKDLSIESCTLPKPIQINGNFTSRIFEINTNATVVLDTLVITNGYAHDDYGGGIYNWGSLTLDHCTVVNNITDNSGGGILNFQATLTVLNSTMANNSAAVFGGGIENDGGAVTVQQCTFTRNICGLDGGAGIDNGGGTLSVVQSTVSDNTANNALGSGGIYVFDGEATVSNSIVSGNHASTYLNVYGNISFFGVNLSEGDPDPMLAPLGNYGGPAQTMPPLVGSPAIDAVEAITAIATPRALKLAGAGSNDTDQRGFPRVSGAAEDIGSVEVFGSEIPVVIKHHTILTDHNLQLSFTNIVGASYTVYANTNAAAPLNEWTNLGPALPSGSSPICFQFSDLEATNYATRFYLITSP